MKAIIIDDELHSRETTRMMLNMIDSTIDIIDSVDNAIDGARLINQHEPELVFLDIQMPNVNGLQMLELIPNYKGEIIFITAFDQYAIEAFKKGAIHYLLKPIDTDELENALNRVKKSILANQMKTNGGLISLSTMEGWIVIKKQDIIHCKSYKNYSTINTKDASYTISKTLGDVEAKLPKNIFYRVHNSHIINIEHIDKVIKADGGSILMHNNESVPISKNKKAGFMAWFQLRIEKI